MPVFTMALYILIITFLYIFFLSQQYFKDFLASDTFTRDFGSKLEKISLTGSGNRLNCNNDHN